MNAPASAFLGAMGPLIRKLEVLLLEASESDPKDWPRFPKGMKDGIDLLKVDLEEIHTYLEDLTELEDPPLTAKCWMKEVRELSYDIEDFIDSFARPSCTTSIKTISEFNISHFQLNRFPKRKKLTWHKQVRIKISEFRIRVQEANERLRRYELDCLNLRRRYAPCGPMLPRRHDEAANLVIDGQMSEFMDTLACDGDNRLKVVSIVGSGGLGKTTCARVLYNKIRGQFDCGAFVSMTRKPNIKKLLHDILTQVQQKKARHDCDEDIDITCRMRNHLHGRRYLIVIDDLWSASEWGIISRAFPEGSQRSRVIVTTQVVDVALVCCCYQPELVFEMKPLDVHRSRKLLFDRIFGSESDCPELFKEVSYKIVDACGGSPLAITNMASLLASHSVILMDQWTYISDSLRTMWRSSSTAEKMRLVLNLSYNNMSHYLKSCLLYFTMYPEGYKLCKDDLVKQWVAEGFIDATEGRDMERVARSYFDELIDRRFIEPADMNYNNEIVSCTVHDIVYDLIAYNSTEENFVTVIDTDRKNVKLSDKVHRLSLKFGDVMYMKKPGNIISSHVRSLAFSGFFTSMPSMTEFALLRVLNLQLYALHGDDILDLTGISELFQLRYMKVVSCVCIELPKNMRGLQYLETLHMDTKATTVPWDIIRLPCLLHLYLPFETNLMDWISDIRSDLVMRIDKLTNLRDLRLTCSTPAPNYLEKNMKELGSLLGGLRNLETLSLVPGSSHENKVVCSPPAVIVSWDCFSPPVQLQRFEWSLHSCIFSTFPKWIGEFGNLYILKIVVMELLRDDIDILKRLPALTALSLYVHTAPVERIVFDRMGFSALKFFKFRCSVPSLKFESDAMPNLLKLRLDFNADREDQHRNTPILIEHLPCLKQIYVKIECTGADAESALTAAVINHPSNPTINVKLIDSMFFGYGADDRLLPTAVFPSLRPFSGWRSGRPVLRAIKAKLQDGYVSYPWEKKMRDSVLPESILIPNSSSFLSMLILPMTLGGAGSRYSSVEDTRARANAWILSSQASGVPVVFMNVQMEALLIKLSGEMASATVNAGSSADFPNLKNDSFDDLKDYQGFGVVNAVRIWYTAAAGEMPVEIIIEEDDVKLGFAISRTEEGFIYISSVMEGDHQTPSMRSGLSSLFREAKRASKLLVVSRVLGQKVLPWITSSCGFIRCFDTVSLSQKLSLHRRALRPILLHVLTWDGYGKYVVPTRALSQPKPTQPNPAPQQVPAYVELPQHKSIAYVEQPGQAEADAGIMHGRNTAEDASFRFHNISLPNNLVWV